MTAPKTAPCCCGTPYYQSACSGNSPALEATTPPVSLDNSGFKTVVSSVRLCFTRTPGTSTVNPVVKFNVPTTNDGDCTANTITARLFIDDIIEGCDACEVDEAAFDATEDYDLEAECDDTLVYTFNLSGEISNCCVLVVTLELTYFTCNGDPLKDCEGSVDQVYPSYSPPYLVQASDIGAGWQTLESFICVAPCTGRSCDSNKVTKIYQYYFENQSDKCVEILLRHANINNPAGCELRWGTPSTCGSNALIGGGPDGAFAFICLCDGDGSSSTITVAYSMEENLACCADPTACFDLEFKVECRDTGDYGSFCEDLLSACGDACPDCT